MFKRQIRHLQRYHQLANILANNGFGWFIQEIGLSNIPVLSRLRGGETADEAGSSVYRRIRKVIQELGPTYVKMGQIASTRPDLLPQELIDELAQLQDRVPPFPYENVKEIIEEELKAAVDQLFTEFAPEPIAAASIGQVHKAKLKSGETVAVKVQRPGIQSAIKTDLEILKSVALLAERRFDWAGHYRISEVVNEFAKSLNKEMDYNIEARNTDRFLKMYKDAPYIKIPEIYWEYTTSKVLVMEFVSATKLNEVLQSNGPEFDRRLLAERISKAIFSQLLDYGFFHADPHPGNLAVLPDNIVVFMDFGMAGRLSEEMQDNFALLIIGMMRRNTDMVIRSVSKMGLVPEDINMPELRKDVDELREKYYDVPLSQVHLGEAVNNIFKVAFRHRIKMPADLTLVGKALLIVEGAVEQLDPEFSIIDVAEPFGRKLLRKRLDPRRRLERAIKHVGEYAEFVSELPKLLNKLTRQVYAGRLTLMLEFRESAELMQKLDRISNRISFSIILLAFSIFMAGLMVSLSLVRKTVVFGGLPLLETGFIFTVGLFVWLLWSIIKSGRL
ncbi:MAG: ABC transporter [Firmicutes bacterium HGW-Firmicutes-8]|nr:MAG: ABC transporter [Firmicutes bacterium HGW-Firmicutes-8]